MSNPAFLIPVSYPQPPQYTKTIPSRFRGSAQIQLERPIMPDPSSLPKLVSNSPADEIKSASKVTPASALTLGSAPALAPKFLPLAWILDPHKRAARTLDLDLVSLEEAITRILARIVQAESKERNAHFRDDYRQAFICISLAAKGEDIPFIQSSYKMYGLHPDKLWPRIVARRKADLGNLYSQFYDENDLLIPSPTFTRNHLGEKVDEQRIAAEAAVRGHTNRLGDSGLSTSNPTPEPSGQTRQPSSVASEGQSRAGSAGREPERGKSDRRDSASELAQNCGVGNQSGPQIVPSPDSPKKPSQSVGRKSEEEIA